MRDITPKQFIKEVLIDEIGDIIKKHPYLSFTLISSGIEFLGICLDKESKWTDQGKSEKHFCNCIDKLFPRKYQDIKGRLFKELRCGLVHSQLSGDFKLTEVKNDPSGALKYENHLTENKNILVLDYLYFDFVQDCMKIISTTYDKTDKMNTPIIRVGPLN